MAAQKGKRKPGRPKAEIDEDIVRGLARIMCTEQEIADVVGVNVSTISRRFANIIEKERSHGKMSLRRAQWETARAGNVSMLIWLGKQWLGQQDKAAHEISGPSEGPIRMTKMEMSRADMEKFIEQALEDERESSRKDRPASGDNT